MQTADDCSSAVNQVGPSAIDDYNALPTDSATESNEQSDLTETSASTESPDPVETLDCGETSTSIPSVIMEFGLPTVPGSETPNTHMSRHEARKATKAVLNVVGRWTVITHTGQINVNGVFDLQQKGKKVTGTLTNQGQPPQKLTARVVNTTDNGGTVKGKVGNLALASKPIGFTMNVIGQDHQTVFQTKDGDFNADGHKIV